MTFGPSMTESELVELAARAIFTESFPAEMWETQAEHYNKVYRQYARAALTAINLPQMLEVVAAARELVEAKESLRLAHNERMKEHPASSRYFPLVMADIDYTAAWAALFAALDPS